jgi:hypothetical protein
MASRTTDWRSPVETNSVHQHILATLRTRVAQALRTDEDKIPSLSAGELLNILFLMAGQWGSVGDYIVTVRSLHTLIGGLVWAKPEPAPAAPQVSTLVQ